MNSTYGNNTRCLFGTDGVRDVANRGVMTPEMAMRLGRAFALFLTEKGTPRPALVIGRDTRRSGQMLEAAVIAGLTSAGSNVKVAGVAPTPEISYAVREMGLHGGVVISASHNPAEYNGIKFLDSRGCKLSDEDEFEIEEYLGDSILDEWRPTGASIGTCEIADTRRIYLERLNEIFIENPTENLSCVVDCANGAASEVFSQFINSNGLNWKLIGNEPDGININDGCGVMDLTRLQEEVLSTGADVGIAFDGDADRTLLIDSSGRLLDGDIMMWVLSLWMKSREKLGSGVTATLMSNMALEDQLANEDIEVHRCQVGDRYVFKTMKEVHSALGGEQSGHLIIEGFSSTGDGPCTGLLFLRACSELDMNIGSLVDKFSRYPQRLTNICTSGHGKILEDMEFKNLVKEAEKSLDGSGRIFVRNSGTEPLLRVLVEARDELLLEQVSNKLIDNIKKLYSLS